MVSNRRLVDPKHLLLAGIMGCFLGPAAAMGADELGEPEAETFNEALGKMTARLSFRYRFEHVDQADIAEKADASTLRTRVTLKSASLNGVHFLAQLANVSRIGDDDYNSTRNGLTQFPVVADPIGTEFNQLYLAYAPDPGTLILGRQRVNRNDQRFIGGVAWRQNEQTYDSFTAGAEFGSWQLDYGYIWDVQRIFGPDPGTPSANFDSNSHIIDVHYLGLPGATLAGYAYLLDLENDPPNSNQSVGLRLSGKREFGDESAFEYQAEYARQSDYGDNPNNYTADYYLIGLGGNYRNFFAKLGWEVLGGDANTPGSQFRTPLATLHKFQGWADKFLTTPDAGVDDRYILFGATFAGYRATAIYHDFSAESGGQAYGDEWNFSLAKTFAGRHKVLLKYANYNAENFATDTKKWWLQYYVAL